jgi:hypothetical protein
MTNIWMETFLGKIGKYLVVFLSEYYYYIIPVVLVYGIFLALSSYNLKRIEKKVDSEIFKQAKDIIDKNPDINFMELADKIDIPLEKIMKNLSFFPYISRQSDFWVVKINITNLKEIIVFGSEKIRDVLERRGVAEFKRGSAIRKNLYLEYIHRVTREKEE